MGRDKPTRARLQILSSKLSPNSRLQQKVGTSRLIGVTVTEYGGVHRATNCPYTIGTHQRLACPTGGALWYPPPPPH